MDLNNLKLFKALNTRMHWLNERQRVVAQNVANADTPQYAARDLSPLDFKSILRDSNRIHLAATHDSHRRGRVGGVGHEGPHGDIQSFSSSPTGNSVVLEEEMLKVTEIAGDYTLMTNIYRKGVGLLRLAISRPGSG